MRVIVCIFVTAFRSLLGNWWNCLDVLAHFARERATRLIPLGSLILSRVTCGCQLWDEWLCLSEGDKLRGSEVGGTPRMICSDGLCHER